MANEERNITVDLQVYTNENQSKTLSYDGFEESNGDPTLRFLKNYIRNNWHEFEGSAMTIKLGDQVLQGHPNTTLTKLGVPWEGSTLVISKVLLLGDFSIIFLTYFCLNYCWKL